MSTVGKVLIVAQIGFSILLMAFAAGVSSVQTNWKAKEKTARDELAKNKTTLQVAQSTLQQERTAAAAAQKNLKNDADKARGEADAAKTKNRQLDARLKQTSTELENTRAEADIAGQESLRSPRRSRRPAGYQRPTAPKPRSVDHAESRAGRKNRQSRPSLQDDGREAQ